MLIVYIIAERDRDHSGRVTNEDLKKEIGDLRRCLKSEMRLLALRLKEVKERLGGGGKQRRFSSPQ